MRRFLSILLASLMVASMLCSSAFAADSPFSDVASTAWYSEAVGYVYENGLFSGTSEDRFSPDISMTRAMFVTVLYRQAKKLGRDMSVKTASKFTDLKAEWYINAVLWAAQNGVVAGKTATVFAPDQDITREQMCVILINFLEKYLKYDLTVYAGVINFADKATISNYAIDAVGKAQNLKLVTGKETSGKFAFDPIGIAARADVAMVMMLESKIISTLNNSTNTKNGGSDKGTPQTQHTEADIAEEASIASYLQAMVTNYNKLVVSDDTSKACLDVLLGTLSKALSAHNNGAFVDRAYVKSCYSDEITRFKSMHGALTDDQLSAFNDTVVRLESTDHMRSVMDYFGVSESNLPQ